MVLLKEFQQDDKGNAASSQDRYSNSFLVYYGIRKKNRLGKIDLHYYYMSLTDCLYIFR